MKKSRKKCPNADKYDAESLPRCGTEKFHTCDACVAKWQAAQRARIERANRRQR